MKEQREELKQKRKKDERDKQEQMAFEKSKEDEVNAA